MFSYVAPFLSLSYRRDIPTITLDSFPDSAYYNTGPKDVCLLITCMAVMAVLRDALRLGVFEPLARWKLTRDIRRNHSKIMTGNGRANGNSHTNGAVSKSELRHMQRSVLRFAEQGWPAVYYPLQWFYGLYVNYNISVDIFHPETLWLGYPHIPLAAPAKIYYLTQTAFSLHQILILNAEAPRKDHWQMMAHHFITVWLLGVSYFFNFTRVGCYIMVLMDLCDIFLPMFKMMRYIGLPRIASDVTFVLFFVSWFITRHVLCVLVIISTYVDLPRIVPFEWSPHLGRFLSREHWVIFCACLTVLRILQLLWFGMACRVAYRVITTGKEVEDERSDEEG
ncbi:TLC domain-containing protein [Mycena maculata]|uniref:TLC domain-containing protein n=1 Tax=Mycena maculata TaxID=230809 RepID=A0AAD7KK06_9AGAR|nr:TLC domain-containing protein [Mycena maculata]